LVKRLGANAAADGRKTDLATALRAFAPQGADAVLALVSKGLTPCVAALRKGGVLAYPNGVEPAPRKRAGIKVVAYDGNSGLRNFERLRRAVDSAKKFSVPIAAQFPLAKAAEAHRRLAGHLLGKIILRIR
jgi:NADPH2:quinone reductase